MFYIELIFCTLLSPSFHNNYCVIAHCQICPQLSWRRVEADTGEYSSSNYDNNQFLLLSYFWKSIWKINKTQSKFLQGVPKKCPLRKFDKYLNSSLSEVLEGTKYDLIWWGTILCHPWMPLTRLDQILKLQGLLRY